MKNLVEDVKRHTPKSLQGYNYLKTTNIYIPFIKLTIECLTRKITDLNLFFESILRLIEVSVQDINEIASILGVSYSIVKEAIIDMVGVDYIYTSENTLSITAKGADALKTRKRIDIKKTYLKDVMVDTITGMIYDADAVKTSKTHKRDVFLESVVRIDSSYLDSHFQDINDVYQLQQKNNSIFENNVATNELYKIIGISYSELHYVENKVYMYKSETSDELAYVFSTDSNDAYKNEFYKQLKESCRPCQEYFFEKNRDLVRRIISESRMIESDVMAQTEKVRTMLYSDIKVSDTSIEAFLQKRYTLNDCEYLSYLYYAKELGYSRIILCTNHLNGLLTHLFCYQLNILADKMPIFVIYDKNEYNVNNSLQYYFKNPGVNLSFLPCENITENLICFDSKLIMHLRENVVYAFDRPVTYMQAICDFNEKNVKENIDRIASKYNLNGQVEESRLTMSKKPNKRQKKDKISISSEGIFVG